MKASRLSLWALLFAGPFIAVWAAPPVIGVAQSRGAFLLNNSSVPGTATILEGASLRTETASSDVSLNSGQRLTISPGSTTTIYSDRMVLESGLAEVRRISGYRIAARNLSIGAPGPDVQFKVRVSVDGGVTVSTTSGKAEVWNAAGLLVAQVFPGEPIEMQPADPARIQLSGVVQKTGPFFTLKDETLHITVELRGPNLAALVGKQVQVSGTIVSGVSPAPLASEIVNVARAEAVPGAVGASGAGAAAAAAAVTPGMSTAATVAIIGGVAVAATAGGLAAAGTFGGSGPSVSR